MKVNNAYYNVLRRPIVTEKAHIATTLGKYTFEVSMCSTKELIKKAVESVFGVTVTRVNTLIRQGKTVRFKGTKGRRKDVKIAVVTLATGQTIDFQNAA